MGTHFGSKLRGLCSGEDSLVRRMEVTSDAEPMHAMVVAAVDALINHKSDKGPTMSLFESDLKPSQKNLVAVVRATLEIQPHCSPINCDYNISF